MHQNQLYCGTESDPRRRCPSTSRRVVRPTDAPKLLPTTRRGPGCGVSLQLGSATSPACRGPRWCVPLCVRFGLTCQSTPTGQATFFFWVCLSLPCCSIQLVGIHDYVRYIEISKSYVIYPLYGDVCVVLRAAAPWPLRVVFPFAELFLFEPFVSRFVPLTVGRIHGPESLGQRSGSSAFVSNP
jgi:hypothetical protein